MRAANRRELNAIFADWARPRTCDEVIAALGPDGADVPVARVASPGELLGDPQLRARDMVERHPHPTLGEVVFHEADLCFGNPKLLNRLRDPLIAALVEHRLQIALIPLCVAYLIIETRPVPFSRCSKVIGRMHEVARVNHLIQCLRYDASNCQDFFD